MSRAVCCWEERGRDRSSVRHFISVHGVYTCIQIYLLLDAFWHHWSSCSLLQFDRYVKLRCVLCRNALVSNCNHPRPFEVLVLFLEKEESSTECFCSFLNPTRLFLEMSLCRPPPTLQLGAASSPCCHTAQPKSSRAESQSETAGLLCPPWSCGLSQCDSHLPPFVPALVILRSVFLHEAA